MDLPFQDLQYYKVPADKDIVLLGHSQIECAVNDSITRRAVNVSKSGDAYIYTYAKLRKIVEANPQIRHVIIEFTNNNIPRDMDDRIYGDSYLKTKYSMYVGTMTFSEKMFLFRRNPITFIQSIPVATKANLQFLMHQTNLVASKQIGGYLLLKRDKTDSLLQHNALGETRSGLSEDNIAALREIKSYCKQKHVTLTFIRTPVHQRSNVRSNEALYDSIRHEYFADVPVIDLKDQQFANAEFGDLEHLNWKGARRFSVMLDSILNNRF